MTQPELELGEEALSALTATSLAQSASIQSVAPGSSFKVPNDSGVVLCEPPIEKIVVSNSEPIAPIEHLKSIDPVEKVGRTQKKVASSVSRPAPVTQRSLSQRLIEQLRSRRFRAILMVCSTVTVVFLLAVNLRNTQETATTDDDLAELALSEFNSDMDGSRRVSYDEEEHSFQDNNPNALDRSSVQRETTNWLRDRNAQPPLGLVGDNTASRNEPLHRAFDSQPSSGAWLTGQIEIESPLQVMPTSSRRIARPIGMEAAPTVEDFDRFSRLAP